MSILTTLALMSTALVAKVRELTPPPPDVEITALKARIDDLNSQVSELEDRLASTNHELTLMRIELVERRPQPAVDPRRELAIQEAHQLMARMQLMQAHANVHHAQAQQANQAFQNQQWVAQNALHNYLGGQGLLGGLGQMNQAQAVAQVMDDAFCNCVPARHDMFTGIFRRNS